LGEASMEQTKMYDRDELPVDLTNDDFGFREAL
jgi:hypothetical protein